MIVSVGIDVVALPRFEHVVDRTPGIVDRLFTEEERRRPDGRERRLQSLAARFAAKEAVAKALGAPTGLSWHDCEVQSDPTGKPSILLRGTAAEAADRRSIARWHVSLTHDGGIASAVVVAETA
ncbi:holo-ACP synthase [Salininema proteolyticum]|uniref:Holo-[acyl-carrier-protein] synthase n=1 Tax=Salininema proteolyticum TaxID=1607685 RepID=A0ABV8TT25_9ACTN